MRTIQWALGMMVGLGLPDTIHAQAPSVGPGGGAIHRPGVVMVVDPFNLPSPEEYQARKAVYDYYSQPVFMDQSDWRLPHADQLHDQMQFGKPQPDPVVVPSSTNARQVEVLGSQGHLPALGRNLEN